MRRAIAAGVALVIVILVVVGVKGCVDSQRNDALRSYNNSVGQIATESAQTVSPKLFGALQGAPGSAALDVETQIDQYRELAQQEASTARGLSVPSQMGGAQQNLLLALDLRAEAITKISAAVRTALGTSPGPSVLRIAGDMETLLASDVIYAQRVAPLISQALSDEGIGGQTIASSQFVTNIAWLNPQFISQALLGHGLTGLGSGHAFQAGRHGHALLTVSVGSQTLSPGTTPNTITEKPGLGFVLSVQNQGQFNEFGVGVQVKIQGAGTPIVATKTIDETIAGQTTSVTVPLSQLPAKGTPLRLVATVNAVPGEKTLSNNTLSYLVVFQ